MGQNTTQVQSQRSSPAADAGKQITVMAAKPSKPHFSRNACPVCNTLFSSAEHGHERCGTTNPDFYRT